MTNAEKNAKERDRRANDPEYRMRRIESQRRFALKRGSRARIRFCHSCKEVEVVNRKRLCEPCKIECKKQSDKKAQTNYLKTESGKKNRAEHKRANVANRRARKLQATPKWLTKEHITETRLIYKNCPKGYEVDHQIPLRGKTVSGLHVPWNLQYLTIEENRSKGNRLWRAD